MFESRKEQDQWSEVVLKLIKLTQDGKLKWRALPVPDTMIVEPDQRVDLIFLTLYKGRLLRLYEKRFGARRPLASPSMGWQLSGAEIILELLDEEAMVPVWTFPQSARLEDLLSAVQYQRADVKKFLDDVLADDEV